MQHERPLDANILDLDRAGSEYGPSLAGALVLHRERPVDQVKKKLTPGAVDLNGGDGDRLVSLVALGEVDYVRDLINQVSEPLDIENPATNKLLRVLANTGYGFSVGDLLDKKVYWPVGRCLTDSQIDLLEYFISKGGGEGVEQFLEKKQVDWGNTEQFAISKKMQFGPDEVEYNLVGSLLKNLISVGRKDFPKKVVTQRLAAIDAAGLNWDDDAVKAMLLVFVVQVNSDSEVAAIILNHPPTDARAVENSEKLLRALCAFGQTENVRRALTDIWRDVPMTPVDIDAVAKHGELWDILADCGFRDEMAKHLAPLADKFFQEHQTINIKDAAEMDKLSLFVHWGYAEKVVEVLVKNNVFSVDNYHLPNIHLDRLLLAIVELGHTELVGSSLEKLIAELQTTIQSQPVVPFDFHSGYNPAVKKAMAIVPKIIGLGWILSCPELLELIVERTRYPGQADDLRERVDVERVVLKERIVAQYTPRDLRHTNFINKFDNFLEQLSMPEINFFRMILSKHGSFLHPRAVEFVKAFQNGEQFFSAIDKGGSALGVIIGSKDSYIQSDAAGQRYRPVVFAHQINRVSAEQWRHASDAGVPVEPIIEGGSFSTALDWEDGVFSRYCGNNLAFWRHVLDRPPLEPLYYLLNIMASKIYSQLDGLGIEHGHPLKGNFTVELINKNYLASKPDCDINQLPFEPSQFSFDVGDYLAEPGKWELVVRLIDWDRAVASSERGV
ncbi:MAG: hypothetical protein A3J93_02670 [Candidatus Magasanikbacteria bacterium RIFOXYC2_FULL_42_28]|uniref:Uncharacterized protein n=1 Tax=Candidatus Magasanikbacteria bacterium RIFOXYC2_FULL_42_28 TaxID=1798704 RepID=A0A1F6NVZ5_9BACT|nr:MAG: hypothetical protein A3J93_02670 [Candidatus Magasanikbacteria bacterium RIFOXYC2_FULL_42_28]